MQFSSCLRLFKFKRLERNTGPEKRYLNTWLIYWWIDYTVVLQANVSQNKHTDNKDMTEKTPAGGSMITGFRLVHSVRVWHTAHLFCFLLDFLGFILIVLVLALIFQQIRA